MCLNTFLNVKAAFNQKKVLIGLLRYIRECSFKAPVSGSERGQACLLIKTGTVAVAGDSGDTQLRIVPNIPDGPIAVLCSALN